MKEVIKDHHMLDDKIVNSGGFGQDKGYSNLTKINIKGILI